MPDDAADTDTYSSFGPGHCTFEVVGDFPVWFGSECRLGRLVDWFGGYGAKGLYAQVWVTKTDGTDSQEEFDAAGRRNLTRIDSGLAVFNVNQ